MRRPTGTVSRTKLASPERVACVLCWSNKGRGRSSARERRGQGEEIFLSLSCSRGLCGLAKAPCGKR